MQARFFSPGLHPPLEPIVATQLLADYRPRRGPYRQVVGALGAPRLNEVTATVRDAYEAGQPHGPAPLHGLGVPGSVG
jgi:hypothetical protein